VNKIPETPLNELASSGWPIPKVIGEFQQARDLRTLIRYLRNAVAHFNIEFIGDGTNEIRTLRVWNKDPRTNRTTWNAEVGVEELRGIADRFGALILGESN
jgi:HEPN pEK499 p136